MIKEKIIRNTLYNILSYFYTVIIGFFLVPFILKNVGIDKYGIWSLITVVVGYFSLIDFGIGQSFERYISEYKTKNEIKNLNYIINSGLLFYIILFIVLIPISFFSQNFLIAIFKISPQYVEETKFLFKWCIIYIGFFNIYNIFLCIVRGFQRMDITGKVNIIISTLHFIGVILFLKNGFGIKGLMVNNFIISSISGLIYFYSSLKIFPEIELNFLIFNKDIFTKLGKFGLKRWITSIEEIITYQTDKFFISHFLNISLVGIYQIGYTIPDKMANMIRVLNSAIVPASAELKTMNEEEKLIKLYIYGTKFISIIAFPLMLFILASAPMIINVWIGPGYETSINVLRLFSIIFLITLLSSNLTAILVGIEKPEFQMYAGLSQGILNLILTFLFIKFIGFLGVIIATLISISLSTFYLIWVFHKILKINFFYTFKNAIAIPFFISTFLNLLVYVSTYFIKLPPIRIKNLEFLILEFLIFTGIYLYFLRKFKWLDIKKYFKIKDFLYNGKHKTNI